MLTGETIMFYRRSRRVLLSLAAVAAAGCVAGGAPRQSATNLPGTEACIFTSTLSDWTVLDESTLIVYAPMRKDPYLIKLFAPVIGLDFHQTLGFEHTAHSGELCRGDELIIRGSSPQRMGIVAVRALTPEQAKELRTAAHKPDAVKQPSPEQQP
jgi:hypothetical protein